MPNERPPVDPGTPAGAERDKADILADLSLTRLTQTPLPPTDENPIPPAPRAGRVKERLSERAFRLTTFSAANVVLIILVAITVFLLQRAIPAIAADSTSFLKTKDWYPDDVPPVFGIAALVYGTLMTSILAVLMAVPVAVGVALSVTQYLPKRVAQPIAYVVDLLAAVPSVVYGLWGLIYLVPAIIPLSQWLSTYFGWIPFFKSDGIFGKSIFTASVVLAIMILPIIAAITRETFTQAPIENKEAAYALGATRWEMIRLAVIPYGTPGLISATLLGFGRAMGETIAVALVLSANYQISAHLLTPGGNTIAANIANTFGDAGTVGQGALIASGLVLFVITLIVNFTARAIIGRRKEFRAAV